MEKIMLRNNSWDKKTVVALGKFDGIHNGHAKLLETASDYACKNDLLSLVYVMEPEGGERIMEIREKTDIIRSFGIDAVCIEPLTKEFMNMTPGEFVKNIIRDTLNACHVVVGYNFRFGKKRAGDTAMLETLCRAEGITVSVIDCVYAASRGEQVAVSSTEIRRLASEGRVDRIQPLLGRNYTLSGVVEQGKKLGRTIGFPTANIYRNKNEVVLRPGVYMTRICLDGTIYYGITNIGSNPTVEQPDGRWRIETCINSFDGDIYGEYITLEFLEFIREERKFASINELKSQLEADMQYVKKQVGD